jgi:hypothetical protein
MQCVQVYVQVPSWEVVVWQDGTSDMSSRGRVSCGVRAEYTASRTAHVTSISLQDISLGFRAQGLSKTSQVLQGLALKAEFGRHYVEGTRGAGVAAAGTRDVGAGGVGAGGRLEIMDKVSIGEMKVEIGYLDVKSLVGIGGRWMAAARERGTFQRHALHELMRAAQRAARAAAYSTVSCAMSNPPTPSASSTTPGTAAATSGQVSAEDSLAGVEADQQQVAARKFVLTSDQLKLCITNDCVGFNVPFVTAVVAPFAVASVPTVGGGLVTRGVLKVEASFYSIVNQCFEPLLEPLKIELTSEVDRDVSGAYNLTIVTKQRAELILSEAHLCTAVATVEAWTSDLSAHINLSDMADLVRANKTQVLLYHPNPDTLTHAPNPKPQIPHSRP